MFLCTICFGIYICMYGIYVCVCVFPCTIKAGQHWNAVKLYACTLRNVNSNCYCNNSNNNNCCQTKLFPFYFVAKILNDFHCSKWNNCKNKNTNNLYDFFVCFSFFGLFLLSSAVDKIMSSLCCSLHIILDILYMCIFSYLNAWVVFWQTLTCLKAQLQENNKIIISSFNNKI